MEKLKITKKPESVLKELASAVLSGRIAGGTEVTQNELAESMEVSRMPVREALIMLEYHGLAERLANQHIKIARIDEKYFQEIFEIASFLESSLLPAENAKTEMDFHRALLEKCENQFVRRILKTYIDVFIPFAIGAKTHDAQNALALLSGSDTESLEEYFVALGEDAWQRKKKGE